ncbi:hypothetical protein FHY55_07160 [Oceanicola sp. D3]|uniref:hypothetical protein n=1 Tax=Oceanicola sp. D3 TaxID=2587163 RepID=UPI0011216A7F|nr:hypothetical protein [Oceanicola sp. D3]QDC09036.1 hypothetical protein FHY55_07160 [Oceanicola sp. D3]
MAVLKKIDLHQKQVGLLLLEVDPVQAVAFGMASFERLRPFMERYFETARLPMDEVVSSSREKIWKMALLRTDLEDRSSWKDSSSKIDFIIPGEDSKWNIYHPLAQDALSILSYCCEYAVERDVRKLEWSARAALDSLLYCSESSDFPYVDNGMVYSQIDRQLEDIKLLKLGEIEKIRSLALLTNAFNR